MAASQFNLATLYLEGKGVNQDYHKAFEWYQRAAAQKDAGALFNLAKMYGLGMGVDKDMNKAKFYFVESCSKGVKSACDISKKLGGAGI